MMDVTQFPIDIWAILALILGAVMILVVAVHAVLCRKRENRFRKELEEKLNRAEQAPDSGR